MLTSACLKLKVCVSFLLLGALLEQFSGAKFLVLGVCGGYVLFGPDFAYIFTPLSRFFIPKVAEKVSLFVQVLCCGAFSSS